MTAQPGSGNDGVVATATGALRAAREVVRRDRMHPILTAFPSRNVLARAVKALAAAIYPRRLAPGDDAALHATLRTGTAW